MRSCLCTFVYRSLDKKKIWFCLECILGGYFHGRNDLTYGVDVDKIRWLGVLQVSIIQFNTLQILTLLDLNNKI